MSRLERKDLGREMLLTHIFWCNIIPPDSDAIHILVSIKVRGGGGLCAVDAR